MQGGKEERRHGERVSNIEYRALPNVWQGNMKPLCHQADLHASS